MTDSDQRVVEYLKANGLYGHLAMAAGVAKDATVTDVHKPSAGGSTRKLTVAYSQVDEAEAAEVAEADADEDDSLATIAKRVVAAGDVVFAKGDASLYVSRPLTPGSAERLHAWAAAQGIPNLVPPELMHATQVHSSTAVDGLVPDASVLDIAPQPRYLDALGDKGALVMFFRSPEMQQRFKEAKAAGASWDFPGFRTHITLSYDAGDVMDWTMADAPNFPLQLGPEEFQSDNPNWVAENGLAKRDGFELVIDVIKAEPDRQQIFGWASVSSINGVEVIDKQGDSIPVDEIEKAAYEFTLYGRAHGEMHETIGTGRLIESCVFTPEKAAAGIVAKNERGEPIMGWWVGFHVNDAATWAKAKAGALPEFSIGGRATPEAA